MVPRAIPSRVGEHALGRQAVSGHELAVADVADDLLDELPVDRNVRYPSEP